MEKIINTLFPPKCVFCGCVGDVFCENCISNCLLLLEQRCIVCDKPSIDGITHKYCYKAGIPTQVLSVFIYGGNVRGCIRKSKYSSRIFMFLKRIRDTKSQHSSSRKQRFKNVSDSFISNCNVKGKKILLIDDITTTGATFLEASKVLYQNGAVDVKCFSLSKKL